MVLAAYGEADPEGRHRLDLHLRHCPDCAARYRALREDLARISENTAEVPEFDWEGSGNHIHAVLTGRIEKRTGSRRVFGMPLKTAAAVGIFCLGVLAGWWAFHSPVFEKGGDAALSGQIFSLLDRHLGNVRLSFLEYANFQNPADRPALFVFEQNQARHLLFQNRLLISHFQQSENQELLGLLDNLNFILQEISNLSREKTESLTFIRSLLRDSDILYRIDFFQRQGIRGLSTKERL